MSLLGCAPFCFFDVFLDSRGRTCTFWLFSEFWGRVFFLLGMVLIFVFTGLSWGCFFCVFCPAYPPAQCRGWFGYSGHSFVAQDTFLELWAGFRWFLAYSVLLFFSSYRSPPARELGAVWKTSTAPTGEQDLLVSCAHFSLFRRHFLAIPTLQVAWRWLSLTIYSSSLRLGIYFFLFMTYLAGFVTLPLKDVGVDFEEPRLDSCSSLSNRDFH